MVHFAEADEDSIEPDSIDGHLSKDISVENTSFNEDLINDKLHDSQEDNSVTEISEIKEEIVEEVFRPQEAAAHNTLQTEDVAVEDNNNDVLSEVKEPFTNQTIEDSLVETETVSKTEEEEDILNSILTADEDRHTTELSFTTDGGEDTSEINLKQSEIVKNKISEQVSAILGDNGDVNLENSVESNSNTVKDNTIIMPEKQDEAEKTSPDLAKAFCRYRWAKNIPTQSDYVMFFCTVKMVSSYVSNTFNVSSFHASEE